MEQSLLNSGNTKINKKLYQLSKNSEYSRGDRHIPQLLCVIKVLSLCTALCEQKKKAPNYTQGAGVNVYV